jgi:hypothetical protein
MPFLFFLYFEVMRTMKRGYIESQPTTTVADKANCLIGERDAMFSENA